MEITGTLEEWYYDRDNNVIWGYVFGDVRKRFRDGTRIHTSSIPGGRNKVFLSGDTVETLNSAYYLGKPLENKE